MKKILISLVTLFCLSTMAMADVELASGSLSALKNAGEYAYVEIDWSKAKVVEFGRGDKVEKSFGTIDQYNKSQGADWVKDWPAVKQDILNFTAWEKYPTRPCFNKKNKKGTLITVNPAVWKSKSSDKDHCIWENPSKAKYKFVLTVEQVDMGNGVAAGFGVGRSTGGAIINGKIKLIEIKTGKQLALIKVSHCKGIGNFSQRTRLVDVVVGEIFGNIPSLIK